MSHIWTVSLDGKDIGYVEAVSRKGACHAAFDKFGIAQAKRSSVSVEKTAHTGGFISEQPPTFFGDIACSFNPALDRRFLAIDPGTPGGDKTVYIDSGRSLADCRMKFDMPPWVKFPEWKKD